MKPSIARYTTLQFQPFPNRTEHLNYGLVVFLPEGGVRVHIASNLRKLKSVYPDVDLEDIRDQERFLPNLVGSGKTLSAIKTLNSLRVLRSADESKLGSFTYSNDIEYNRQVKLALDSLCESPKMSIKERDSKSKLFIDVRAKFKALGIMAKEKGVIPDHQVVEQYIPDEEADVKVEFALQNGLLRMAQTIDLRADSKEAITSQHRQAAYSKVYALHFAKHTLHQSGLKSYVIVAGAQSDQAQKVLHAIETDVDKILEWENRRDMEGFFTEWAEAAGKPLPAIPFF